MNLFEFLKPERTVFGILEKELLGGNIVVVLVGFMLYYLTLSLQQDFGSLSKKSRGSQLFMMAGVSNVLGLITLAGALLLMAP